jgi:predicted nuclease of predicted toxin-antitoxin system
VRFLIDTQLPIAFAPWLQERGYLAEHVLAIGLAQAKDSQIWYHAEQQRAVIVTKDEDFAGWVLRGRVGPSVVWLRVGNSSKRALLTWLEPLWPAIIKKLEEGERLIEVR